MSVMLSLLIPTGCLLPGLEDNLTGIKNYFIFILSLV
jgi:hypothetical protein